MVEVGVKGAAYHQSQCAHHHAATAETEEAQREPPQRYADAYENQEQKNFFDIQHCVKGEDICGMRTEHHIQHKAVDVEAVDVEDLHIEKQQQAHNRYEGDEAYPSPFPLAAQAQWDIEQQKRNKRQTGSMGNTRGDEEHPPREVHHRGNNTIHKQAQLHCKQQGGTHQIYKAYLQALGYSLFSHHFSVVFSALSPQQG